MKKIIYLFLLAVAVPGQHISAQNESLYFKNGNLYIVGSSHQDN